MPLSFFHCGGVFEAVVQPDEVERGADPGDAGDQVQPAQDQAQPVYDVAFHSLAVSNLAEL
jgi:hypothetical protein